MITAEEVVTRIVAELIRPYTVPILLSAANMLLQYTTEERDVIRFISFIKDYRGDPTVAVKRFIYNELERALGSDIISYVDAENLSLKVPPEIFVRFVLNTKVDIEQYPILVSFLNKQGFTLEKIRLLKSDRLEGTEF